MALSGSCPLDLAVADLATNEDDDFETGNG